MEYLKYRLFQPLGFDKVLWDKNPDGIEYGAMGIKGKAGRSYKIRGTV